MRSLRMRDLQRLLVDVSGLDSDGLVLGKEDRGDLL